MVFFSQKNHAELVVEGRRRQPHPPVGKRRVRVMRGLLGDWTGEDNVLNICVRTGAVGTGWV